MKKLEARIVRCALRNRDAFAVLGDPSRDSLPYSQLQAIDDIRMRVLGSAKDEFIAFGHIDEAGVTLYEGRRELDDTSKNFMKTIGGAKPDGDVMEHIDVRIFN